MCPGPCSLTWSPGPWTASEEAGLGNFSDPTTLSTVRQLTNIVCVSISTRLIGRLQPKTTDL